MCMYCGKEFKYSANLKQHFLRKNPCAVEKSHATPYAVKNSYVKPMQSLSNPCLEKNTVPIRLSLI
jgi:hypothetical protein